jgi:predicted Zn-dependent protease
LTLELIFANDKGKTSASLCKESFRDLLKVSEETSVAIAKSLFAIIEREFEMSRLVTKRMETFLKKTNTKELIHFVGHGLEHQRVLRGQEEEEEEEERGRGEEEP